MRIPALFSNYAAIWLNSFYMLPANIHSFLYINFFKLWEDTAYSYTLERVGVGVLKVSLTTPTFPIACLAFVFYFGNSLAQVYWKNI